MNLERLVGDKSKPTLIFVHGFGTASSDLRPLALSFHEAGFTCVSFELSNHESSDALVRASYQTWYNQLDRIWRAEAKLQKNIYLVGFSLGATICIDFARRNEVSGVIAISPFFNMSSKIGRSLIRVAMRLFPRQSIGRIIQTTDKATRIHVNAVDRLPFSAIRIVLCESDRVFETTAKLNSPLLVLHSMNDRVACYETAINFCRKLDSDWRVITVRGLNHFLQFDVPPSALRDLIISWINVGGENEASTFEMMMVKESFDQSHQEHRQWAEYLFKLIVGFFTIFGVLLYNTLADVLDKKVGAPYFLLAYATAINVYLVITSMYFYYMNRIIIYLKNHIEPLIAGLQVKEFTTNPFVAGKTSVTITKTISTVLVGIPLIVSICSIIYALKEYDERFFAFESRNILLQSWGLATAMMISLAIRNFIVLQFYTAREMYSVPTPDQTNWKLEQSIMKLYSRIHPGSGAKADNAR